MAEDARIKQFKQMAEADPDNELGHLSLGKAYLDSGRADAAIQPLTRALELNGRLSKAYQLLGEALDRAGGHDKAVEVLTRGVTAADEQGDLMPRDAMMKMLRDWGAPVPVLKSAASEVVKSAAAGASVAPGFQCSRCGSPAGHLEKPPFKGALGKTIFDHVCRSCWREWIPMGTKVINELGLVLSSQAGQQAYDQYMIEFLQLEER